MPLLMTKLKNQVAQLDAKIEPVKLRNVAVAGKKTGCAGYFRSPRNNNLVYVLTESAYFPDVGHDGQALVRYARSIDDSTGGKNHYSSLEELPQVIVEMLLAKRSEVKNELKRGE